MFLMSALSLKTRLKKKRKKKSKNQYLFLCVPVSENNGSLNLCFMFIKLSGTDAYVTNKPNNIFIFKNNLRRILFINVGEL